LRIIKSRFYSAESLYLCPLEAKIEDRTMACIETHSIKVDEVLSLVNQVKSHAAWKDSLSLQEVETKLEESTLYSYLITPAEQETYFYLSFLDRNNSVHHHLFTIVPSKNGALGFKNGGVNIQMSLENLIPYSIGCSPGACRPCV